MPKVIDSLTVEAFVDRLSDLKRLSAKTRAALLDSVATMLEEIIASGRLEVSFVPGPPGSEEYALLRPTPAEHYSGTLIIGCRSVIDSSTPAPALAVPIAKKARRPRAHRAKK